MHSALLAILTSAFTAPEDAVAGSDAAHSSGGLPQLDVSTWPGQVFWLLVTFGILFFLLSRMVLPKIGATIEDRRDRIADDLDVAAQNQQEAEDAVAAYEKGLADARAKAHSIVAATRAEVDAKIAAESADAEAQLAAQLDEAEKRIAAIRAEAQSHVSEIADEVAAVLVAKLTADLTDSRNSEQSA